MIARMEALVCDWFIAKLPEAYDLRRFDDWVFKGVPNFEVCPKLLP